MSGQGFALKDSNGVTVGRLDVETGDQDDVVFTVSLQTELMAASVTAALGPDEGFEFAGAIRETSENVRSWRERDRREKEAS